MTKILMKSALAVVLVTAGVLGIPRTASAYIEIDYSIDNGARTFGASSNSSAVTFNGTGLGGGLFDVLLTIGTTNTPGNGNQALVTQSNNTVTTDYASGTHTLHIYASSTGFTQPQSPPPTILGNASSITENGGHTDVVFTSYADATNTLFGTTGPSTSVAYSANDQTGVGGGNSFTFFSPNGATYSLTNIGDFKLTGGTSLTVVSGNTKVTPTPVPGGFVLALSGLPMLGMGYWLRRRQMRLIQVA